MRGSMTMAVADLAPVRRTVFSSTSSAVVLDLRSSVSRTFAPETGSTCATVLRVWPAGSRTMVSLPALPESSSS